MKDCPGRSSWPAAGVEAVEEEEDEDEDDGQEDPEQPEHVGHRQDCQPDVLHLLQGDDGQHLFYVECINDTAVEILVLAKK